MKNIKKFVEAHLLSEAKYAIYTSTDGGLKWTHEMDFEGTASEASEEANAWRKPGVKCKIVSLTAAQWTSQGRDYNTIIAGKTEGSSTSVGDTVQVVTKGDDYSGQYGEVVKLNVIGGSPVVIVKFDDGTKDTFHNSEVAVVSR